MSEQRNRTAITAPSVGAAYEALRDRLEELALDEAHRLARSRSFNDFNGVMIHNYAHSLLCELLRFGVPS